ncbi:DUF5063 domain-containing protein [Ornithinimicrobium pekingense]|uniref:DUF5063 domain-containing protein n=1 Tax=Ornithinimicrobium pekingense TaxID=384677 RepID=A0ABQ2F467_9MICO|nr:DUF5063 domain-containing protein [Ornithinimicrobium pekingense]GGK57539.1 DUF5063 domain-containing protein [Ornithinimicrobium pekingense]
MSETAEDGWDVLAEQMHAEVTAYFAVLHKVASGEAPETALPVLLLAVGQLCGAGARIGALVDVVPEERFEPDAGPDPDLEEVRARLHALLGGVDTYCDLEDPVLSGEVVSGSLSADLVAIASDLEHGRAHFEAGRPTEAMWWWQFSYVSSWGERAAAALRVLLALLSHVRLDADDEQVMEAEMAALHQV